jgi:sugar lactone lactonase YvrE
LPKVAARLPDNVIASADEAVGSGGLQDIVVGEHAFRCVSAIRDLLGEGPVWSQSRSALYWVDIAGRRVRCHDGRHIRSWAFDDTPGSLACTGDNSLLVALGRKLVSLDMESGRVKTLHAQALDRSPWRYNDGKCDPSGRFIVGEMPIDTDLSEGALTCFDSAEGMRRLDNGFQVPNGLAWSPDGATMYFADSRAQAIYAYHYDVSTGEIGDRRIFARVQDGVPDGATVDRDGFLWSAEYGAGAVNRFAPDGQLHSRLRLPLQYPTSCAFGGPHLETLFITSATLRTTTDDLSRFPMSGFLIAVEPGVGGLPEPEFRP